MRRPREGAGGGGGGGGGGDLPDLTSIFPEIGFCNGRTPPSLRLDPSEKIISGSAPFLHMSCIAG